MRMNATPVSAGIAEKSFLNASSPPAEAPMPTIGNPGFASPSGDAAASLGSAGGAAGPGRFALRDAVCRRLFCLAAMPVPQLLRLQSRDRQGAAIARLHDVRDSDRG